MNKTSNNMHEEEKSYKQTNKKKTLQAYRAEKAVIIVKENLKTIPNVQSWAEQCRISRRSLYQCIKQEFECPPKELLRDLRYRAIKECIKNNPEATGYYVALEVGLKNDRALFNFLKNNFKIGLRILRIKILNRG